MLPGMGWLCLPGVNMVCTCVMACHIKVLQQVIGEFGCRKNFFVRIDPEALYHALSLLGNIFESVRQYTVLERLNYLRE